MKPLLWKGESERAHRSESLCIVLEVFSSDLSPAVYDLDRPIAGYIDKNVKSVIN